MSEVKKRLVCVVAFSNFLFLMAIIIYKYPLMVHQPYNHYKERSMQMSEKDCQYEENITAISDPYLLSVLRPKILYDSDKDNVLYRNNVNKTGIWREDLNLLQAGNGLQQASTERIQWVSNCSMILNDYPHNPLKEKVYSTRDLLEEKFTGKLYQ